MLVGLVGKEFLLIFLDQRKPAFREEESLVDGSLPNGLSFSIPHLLEEAVHGLEGKHPDDVPDRSVMRSVLLRGVPSEGFQLSRFSPEEIVMHVGAEVAIDEVEPVVVYRELTVGMRVGDVELLLF